MRDVPVPADFPTARQWLGMQARAKGAGYFSQLPSYARIEGDDEVSQLAREQALAHAIALCEARLSPPDTPWKPLPIGPHRVVSPCQSAPAKLKTLTAAEAASRFHQWLIRKGHVGEFSSARLSALYASHCREERLAKAPENTLRHALKSLPGGGVTKAQADNRKGGKGPRPVVWKITAPVTRERRAA
jgi:hypothetical protein